MDFVIMHFWDVRESAPNEEKQKKIRALRKKQLISLI